MLHAVYIILSIMSEGRQTGEQLRLNSLQSINSDPYLSEFKYHFILHRVQIPQLQFGDFAANLYRYFRSNLSPSAIYILQIVQTYDNFFFDVAVGFRRDMDAINIYDRNQKIFISGREVEIELAQAFKLYFQSRQSNLAFKKNQRRRNSHSYSSSESQEGYRRRRKQSNRRSSSRSNSYSPSKSRSRSRDNSPSLPVSHFRAPFRGRLYLPLVPYEWRKDYLQAKICEQRKCSRYNISIEQKKRQLSSMIVTVRSQSLYDQLLNGIRIGQHLVLFLREDDVKANGIRSQVRKYQFRAVRTQATSIDIAFQQLASFLLNFKDFHLKVVMITCLEGAILVTTQTKISNILKFIKLGGWKFQAVNFVPRMNPTLQDRWFQYISNRNKNY